jgi:hypothetical protein
MSKKEIIKEIMFQCDCDREQAKEIFRLARQNGDIDIVVNWIRIGNILVASLLIVSLIYFFWNKLF